MAKKFWSPGEAGFFDDEIHGQSMPDDAIPISDERHAEMIEALNEGMEVRVAGGKLSLVAPVPPTETDLLNAQREAAWTTRTKLCLGCIDLGILTEDEALVAAGGDWPDSFTGALDALPVDISSTRAMIVWKGQVDIWRMDPVLLAVQSFKNIPDAALDALFGIARDPASTEGSEEPVPQNATT